MAPGKVKTPGLGIEYEVHVPAYFALLLNINPDIEDFRLRSNVKDLGNLDDLLIDINTKSGKNLYFAFQLKHKEKSSKNLLPTNFEAKGDFNLEKYCEAFKKLSQGNKKYHFILYTNKNFDSNRTNEVKNFCMEQTQDVCCLGRNFFDTSSSSNSSYKFEVNQGTKDGKNVKKKDYKEFFSKFSLYTGQANIRNFTNSRILNILKYKECYVKYVDFFRRWHRGDFTNKILDKKTLNVHLLDILLSSVALNYYFSDGQDRNLILFEETVQQFDITIIDTSKQEIIKQFEEKVHNYPQECIMIRLAKDYKFIDRFAKKLNEETKVKLLHYFYQKPLILDFNEASKDLIYEASKLCRIKENKIKLVILGQDIDASKFSHLKIFTNVTQLDTYFLDEIKKRCKLSLQGRNISFEEMFEDKIREFVTPREIFQMLKGSFTIGEDKENVPECYIPRTVSTTVFEIESIIKHPSRSAAIIFYCEDKLYELKTLVQKIVDSEDYKSIYSQDAITFKPRECLNYQLNEEIPTIILRNKEYSRNQLNDIQKETGKDDIRLFKVINKEKCLLLMSTKDTSFKENYKSSIMSLEENKIHDVFNNSINILCAQLGMGKSGLMRKLQNKCNPSFWTIRVDLKAHNQFLKKNLSNNPNINQVLNFFLELEDCKDKFLSNIKTNFLEKQKIVLFLDGLDEVEKECVDCVLNITKKLSDMGFRIWLSSRQNLQQKIENYFKIFAIEIDEINENQQKKYIEERLTLKYSKNEIEEIVEKIFNNTDLLKNPQILEIPLQLEIITQIFIDDISIYSNINNNNFILTEMFKIFKGKYKHFVTKFESRNPHLFKILEEQLEKIYETVGLHAVLDNEHFQKLEIKSLMLTQIKNSDFLGIITEVNKENKAVFENLAFAEYFAFKFLEKNSDKTSILKEENKEILAEKYQHFHSIHNILRA